MYKLKNMEKENKQHVQLPNDMTTNLTPIDLLVYVSVRRYLNSKTGLCCPSLETIVRNSSLSKPTVIKCIEALKKSGFINYKVVGRSRHYSFSDYKKFEPFSYEFLDNDKLTANEKAYWLASQQWMFKDEKGLAKSSLTTREIAEKINWSQPSVTRCEKSFKDKGLMTTLTLNCRDEHGLRKVEKVFYLDEFGQAVVHCLQNHEERINTNEKTLDLVLRELEKVKEELRILKNPEQKEVII